MRQGPLAASMHSMHWKLYFRKLQEAVLLFWLFWVARLQGIDDMLSACYLGCLYHVSYFTGWTPDSFKMTLLSMTVLVAQWIERPLGGRKVMGSIPVGDSSSGDPKYSALAISSHCHFSPKYFCCIIQVQSPIFWSFPDICHCARNITDLWSTKRLPGVKPALHHL